MRILFNKIVKEGGSDIIKFDRNIYVLSVLVPEHMYNVIVDEKGNIITYADVSNYIEGKNDNLFFSEQDPNYEEHMDEEAWVKNDGNTNFA